MGGEGVYVAAIDFVEPLAGAAVTLNSSAARREYVLSIPRTGGVEALRHGDLLSISVLVEAGDGEYPYEFVGRVIYVGQSVVRVRIPAMYCPIVSQIYRNHWPLRIRSIKLLERRPRRGRDGHD